MLVRVLNTIGVCFSTFLSVPASFLVTFLTLSCTCNVISLRLELWVTAEHLRAIVGKYYLLRH